MRMLLLLIPAALWGQASTSGGNPNVSGNAGGLIPNLAPIATSGSASDLSTGTVPTARLGSGVANSTTCLYGDQTYKSCGSALTPGPTGALVVTGSQIDVDTAIVPLIATGTNWLGAQNASGAALTAPMRIAASAPGTCDASIREFYYNTSSNSLFVCNTTNTWTAVGGADAAARPTYLWSDMCLRGSSTGWAGTGWQNLNGTWSVSGFAGRPACTASLEVSGSGDNARIYMGDGGDKIVRLDGDWDFSFDLAATAQNDKTIRIGVNQGTTVGNDSCWIQGDRVDATTPYTLYCRQGGVDGTPTTMTGSTITADRTTFRIRRVGSTVFGRVGSGAEFSVTTRLPTSTFPGTPMVQWINDVGGASGTIFVFNTGMGR